MSSRAQRPRRLTPRIIVQCMVVTSVLARATIPAMCQEAPPSLPDVDISDSIEGGPSPLFGNSDGSGLFGGGGLFGGRGGGGPFANLNPQQLLSQAGFFATLMALFKGSNTQQSAGSSIQNLRNIDAQLARGQNGASPSTGGANAGAGGDEARQSSSSSGGNSSSSSSTTTSASSSSAASSGSSRSGGGVSQSSSQSERSGSSSSSMSSSSSSSARRGVPSSSDSETLPTGSFFPKDFVNNQ